MGSLPQDRRSRRPSLVRPHARSPQTCHSAQRPSAPPPRDMHVITKVPVLATSPAVAHGERPTHQDGSDDEETVLSDSPTESEHSPVPDDPSPSEVWLPSCGHREHAMHYTFVLLTPAVANPAPFIHHALDMHLGPFHFEVLPSSRGAMLLRFLSIDTTHPSSPPSCPLCQNHQSSILRMLGSRTPPSSPPCSRLGPLSVPHLAPPPTSSLASGL